MTSELPELHRRQSILRAGGTDCEIRSRYTKGEWRRLGRGVYVDDDAIELLAAGERHLLSAHALLPSLSDGAVLSHESAAVIHGLPLFGVDLGALHVTRNRRSGGRCTDSVITHCSPLDSFVVVDGLPVTSVARTIVDIARTKSLDTAVVLGDLALRMGVSDEDLAEELNRARRWKGIAAARRAVAMLEPRSESIGESLSRVRLWQHGFGDSKVQMEILDAAGMLIARTDFLVKPKVVGESDGRSKYVKYLKPGEAPGDVVFREKQREDSVRDSGYEVVRWTWAELWHFDVVVRRIRAAIARAERTPAPVGFARQGWWSRR